MLFAAMKVTWGSLVTSARICNRIADSENEKSWKFFLLFEREKNLSSKLAIAKQDLPGTYKLDKNFYVHTRHFLFDLNKPAYTVPTRRTFNAEPIHRLKYKLLLSMHLQKDLNIHST